ncbi:hypothetical protein C0J52_27405 [Blattella germanica]|nr:hypothetical protein C0J52_27405 [Blattella germanica]
MRGDALVRREIQYTSCGVSIEFEVVSGTFLKHICFGLAGLSALQYVDLNSPRNLYIVGFSLFFGLVLPKWMKGNPHAVQTGIEVADSVVTVLLSTSILVGGALGCARLSPTCRSCRHTKRGSGESAAQKRNETEPIVDRR